MFPNWLTYVIIIIIWTEYILDRILDELNARSRKKPIPEQLSDLYDESAYRKAMEYHTEKHKIGRISTFLNTSLLLGAILYGLPGRLSDFIAIYTEHPVLQALAFFGIVGVIGFTLSLPFSIYNTFVIEEKYGFNRTTPATFITDTIKSLLISSLLGGALLSAVVIFYQWQPQWFWVYAWVLFSGFSLFMAMFYTSWLVPLFNKLSPLQEGSLRDKLMQLANATGFELKNVMVMDSSKRSSKANAYFSGFGPKKTIVLFDTLLEQLNEDEVVAIMAHEIGHYKRKHILKGMTMGTIQMGVMLFLLSLCIQLPVFHEALGTEQPSFHIGLIAFSLLYSPLSTVTGIAMNLISRKNEYEADAYAAQFAKASDLVSGLKKLHKESLSNVNPHPAYVFMHYSHPTLLQRMEKLNP
jgi:STE24 endopeptidase